MKAVLRICLTFFWLAMLPAEGRAPEKWVEYADATLSPARQADGDSFAMEWKSPKGRKITRTFRLYGADCPESDANDPVLKGRIMEQAQHFGVKPEAIPGLGKQAAEFTKKLLTDGKPLIRTFGGYGEKTQKAPGRPQRYYALVEVMGPDGKRHWLHELLLEAGLARAFGKGAPWPAEEVKRHGEKEAGEKFEKDLKRIETKAERERRGAWNRP
ncbi:MAG: hypothetical protein ABI600_04590 [Luteolibacter sp.]